MTHLDLRRLVGLIGVTTIIGLVFVTAYGATIDCTGQFNCVGTDGADTFLDDQDTAEIQGLGGDDTITVSEGFARNQGGNNDGATKSVFAGPGNDTIGTSAGQGTNNQLANTSIFAEVGNDTIRINTGDQTNNSLSGTFDGGRGDDTILIEGILGGNQDTDTVSGGSLIKDGPGQDVIFQDTGDNQANNSNSSFTVRMTEDNEDDTVRLDLARGDGTQNNATGSVAIVLSRGSGRDVIQCNDPNINQDQTNADNANIRQGTVILNGNRKAVDPQGNNLFRAARLGGVAETGCDAIIP